LSYEIARTKRWSSISSDTQQRRFDQPPLGATQDKDLPVGRDGFQLDSLATPNG
jgi:hypothetical protein